MSQKSLLSYASLLTVSGLMGIIYALFWLMLDYRELAKGEGWGVIAVIALLFWSSILLVVGLLIRKFIKNTQIRLIIEGLIFLVLLYAIFIAD